MSGRKNFSSELVDRIVVSTLIWERGLLVEQLKSVWMDGKLVDWDDAKVPVLTHALHYGTGAFEGIRGAQPLRVPRR